MRSAGFVVIVLLCCSALAAPTHADDEQSEVWIFEKGPVTRELDVTHMPDELRAALLAQLEASGWKRVAVDVSLPEDEDESGQPQDPPAPQPPVPAPLPSVRKDLEELVKRGGRLPEGFVPHGMPSSGAMTTGFGRAVGKLILRFLEAKDDPVKGPIYEGVLRDLAQALTAEPDEPGAVGHALGMRLLENAMKGLAGYRQHPRGGAALGSVYRDVVDILREALDGSMQGLRPGAPPRPPTPPLVSRPLAPRLPRGPIAFAGGILQVTARGGETMDLLVHVVPPGSLADQMGLSVGDLILGIDGEAPTHRSLGRAAQAIREAGKLSLRVKRKDGQIEQLDIEFEVADRPADGR